MTNAFDTKCPHCGKSLTYSPDQIGMVTECPYCSRVVIVTQSSNGHCERLPIPITTTRLVLRNLRETDADDVLALMSDQHAFQYDGWTQIDESEIGDWMRFAIASRITRSGERLHLAVEMSELSGLVGLVSIYYLDDDPLQAGFTILVEKGHCQRGYGTEVLRAIQHFGFVSLNLHRFAVGSDVRNVAAVRLLAKAGMRPEGLFKQDRKIGGEWVDTAWYAMLRDEFGGKGLA
jgi:[ribosomal protein S5]-alanine N-acetyltransferase